MSEKNDYIPFFRSYAEFYWRLGTEAQKAGYIDMILNYAFNGVEPSVESETFGVFTLIKPNIDRSLAMLRARAAAGSKKTSAKGHPGNKHATKTEQNQNKIRTEKEKEKESNTLSLSPNGANERECAREDDTPDSDSPILPTPEEMHLYAKHLNIPVSYLDEFLADWRAMGWERVNRGGSVIRLNRSNFKAQLGAFWRQRQKDAEGGCGGKKKTTAQLDGVTLPDDDFDYSRFGGQK